ncbi:nanos RNA binding domain-containing protein [Phthorimaea operculella]|nr:nanos RNA binding domain-containing protein [Phthorimaea operculella]
MEDQKPINLAVSASETKATATESFAPSETRGINMNSQTESMFSPLAAHFQGRAGNELLAMMGQQEPRQADTAPMQADVDLMNFRMNGSEHLFDDMEQNSAHNFYMGNSRAESVASSNMWSDGTQGTGVSAARNGEMIDTFDFLVKSLSSANNYVSMLTREQLSVLRSIRPSLLYEFLQEVAKVRGDKRMRRALPNECAFCKNNGENEECYSSHALKDWRGRVLCPVLRAFRCPRCGATGDRAHTIKYCQENNDNNASEHSGLSGRRRAPSSLLHMPARGSMPAAPNPSPSPASAGIHHSSLWGNFGIN